MPQISIGDLTGSVQIDVSNNSSAAQSELSQLITSESGFFAALSKPVLDPTFQDATFAATFDKPSITAAGNLLDVNASINSTMAVARSADSPLFGSDDYDPIEIDGDDCWVSFELDTLLDASVAVPLPEGFGVSFEGSTAPEFATYVRIPAAQAPTTNLSQAIAQTLEAFKIISSSDDLLAIPQDLIYTTDISGNVKIGGSWALPLAVNQLSLADANLPFNASVSVTPSVTLQVAGDIAFGKEFSVRMRRTGPNTLYLGIYKKKGSTLEASFTAAAGLSAGLGNNELISKFFEAFAPGIDTTALPADQAAEITQVLNDGIDHSLAVSLNAACSAAKSDEAAFAYSVDLSNLNQATKNALSDALHGDWTALAQLPNAKQLRNVVVDTVEKEFSLTLNVLGLFNYRSVADFIKSMKIVRNAADGSVTLTDTATASWISTASTPLAAADRLRSALYEGFLATATYQAMLAGTGANPVFSATQGYSVYKSSMDYRDALKQLNAGLVLGVMPASVKSNLPAVGSPVQHPLFTAARNYSNDDVLRFFFSDVQHLIPRTAASLKQTGRRILAALLDPQDTTDQRRIEALGSDQSWAEMDENPAGILPPFYSDWYDITMWAGALAKVGPLLADVIAYAKSVTGDPSADQTFMKKRKALALALDGATHNTHAAFDESFPICVMSALAGPVQGTPAGSLTFEADWNSKTVFTYSSPAGSAAKLTQAA